MKIMFSNFEMIICPKSVFFKYLTNSVAPDPEGSSPHSQQPANGPYSEPGESTPYPLAYLPKVRFDLILPPTPWSSKWSLSFGFSHQNSV
jgi:hypothetical protein